MALPLNSQPAVIASGAVVSGTFEMLGARAVGVLAPAVVTSCQVFVQVASDTTSANFRRASKSDGSGDWTWSLGVGNKGVSLHDFALPFRYGRLEASVAQTDNRSFAILTKV